MELTKEQYEKIEMYLPKQRGNVKIPNLQMLNALLYMAENGCKWRGWPAHFGRWHSIYMRMSRWAKSGVLDRVFEKLKEQMNIPPEALSMDSTSVKVHPDGTGALKKRPASHRKIERRLEYKDSYACCCQRSPSSEVLSVAGERARRA